MRARDDEPRQLELRRERVGRHVVALHHQAVPLAQERVGDAHCLPELLLRRLLQTDVVAARSAHPSAVPAVEVLDGERDLRLEAVGLHHVAPIRRL